MDKAARGTSNPVAEGLVDGAAAAVATAAAGGSSSESTMGDSGNGPATNTAGASGVGTSNAGSLDGAEAEGEHTGRCAMAWSANAVDSVGSAGSGLSSMSDVEARDDGDDERKRARASDAAPPAALDLLGVGLDLANAPPTARGVAPFFAGVLVRFKWRRTHTGTTWVSMATSTWCEHGAWAWKREQAQWHRPAPLPPPLQWDAL